MKKIISALAALAVGFGLAVVAVPVAASAHTAGITGDAQCQPDGTITVIWTVNTGSVPGNTYGEAKVIKDTPEPSLINGQAGQVWLYEWPEHAANHGLPPLAPNSSFQITQSNIPGNAGNAQITVQIDWKDGFSHDPEGKVKLPKDCTPPDALDAAASINVTPGTCLTPGSATLGILQNVTWDGVLDLTPGAHTEQFTATQGHKFPGGAATLDLPYTVPDRDLTLCPTNVCAAENAGPTSTDLVDLWTNVDTRAKGHIEYVEGALHVWTENNSSLSKVSEGYPANFALKNTGVLDIQATANPGNVHPYGPGLNLFVDFDNNGSVDGTLVYEAVYGQDLWLTNGSAQFVKDAAPVVGGGNGSQWHGTIDQWLTKFPNAGVKGIAYALGSGVQGDWNITSITAGCTEYRFDKVDLPETPGPKVEWTYTNWEDGWWFCGDTSVTITREATKTTTTYKVIVNDNREYEVVIDQVIVDPPVTEYDIRQLDESELIICATPESPIFKDPCGFVNDTVVLPETEGVTYTLTWSEDGNTATVTATADEGYELVPAEGEEELVTEWTYTFTNEACPLPEEEAPPLPEGLANTGFDPTLSIIGGAIFLGGVAFLIFAYRRRQHQ